MTAPVSSGRQLRRTFTLLTTTAFALLFSACIQEAGTDGASAGELNQPLPLQIELPRPDIPQIPLGCAGPAPACPCASGRALCFGRNWTCVYPGETCNGKDD